MIRVFLSLAVCIGLVGCKPTEQNNTVKPTANHKKSTDFVTTKVIGGSVLTVGDSVKLTYQLKNGKAILSAEIGFDDKKTILRPSDGTLAFKPNTEVVGTHNFSVSYLLQDSTTERDYLSFIYRSEVTPKNREYELIATYPHDAKAYTQGLFYHNGFLYESTGHQGQSSVRKVAIQSGKIIQLTTLEANYFGEGLTMINNQVFQITYKAQLGFVYDLETLKPIRQVNYQIMEGWGLAYNGTQLIMSDGSAKIYFIEDEYFTEIGRQEVFDDKGMVTNLNELEYVNGQVYANVYGQKHVVVIDPESGKVTEKIDLTALFPKNIPDNIDHVLNGIAYNPDNGHFFVTGKYWPVLYEIKLRN